MATLMVPPVDLEPWPTLGPKVVRWIRQHLVFGPGDRRGQPAEVDDELEGLLYRLYEVYPQGHQQAGRRRFKRGVIQLPKGARKTSFAIWLSICELHPDAPVRCFDFDGHGNPLGEGVTDPYIPMLAYTEEQSEELAFGGMRTVLQHSPSIVDDFDIGLDRILRADGSGRAEAVSSSPNARDGALTTYQHFDESHRMTSPKHRQAHTVMLRNITKRWAADGWSLETTTSFAPGEGSVAETSWEYANAILEGRAGEAEPHFFLFYRGASEHWDWEIPEQRREAVIEAAGPIVSTFIDVEGIVQQYDEIGADKPYMQRVHGNLIVQSATKAFDAKRWQELANPHEVAEREWITLGFDGSRYYDSTDLVATHILTGYQWLVGHWERPYGPSAENWEVPAAEVDAAVADCFKRFRVWRVYADPPYWRDEVRGWAGQYGAEHVVEWYTNRDKQMAYAVQGFLEAMKTAALSHDGSEPYARHIGNACKRLVSAWDDQGDKGEKTRQLFVITKDRPGSVNKIDGAVAGVLSWQARLDALASGISFGRRSAYEDHRLVVV